jgi:hypothetical protein
MSEQLKLDLEEFNMANIDDIDTSKLDFGNDLMVADPEPEPEPQPEPQPEPEPEPEPQPEPTAEPKPEPQQEQTRDDIRVPKSRLDDEISKRRTAEQEVANLREFIARLAKQPQQEQAQPQQEFDEAAKIKAEYDALIEGDTEKALAIRREISEYQRRTLLQEMQMQTQTVDTRVRDDIAFNARLDEIVSNFPVFNEASEQFNPRLAQMAVRIGDAYVAQQGMTRTQALERTIIDLQEAGILTPAQAQQQVEPLVAAQEQAPKPSDPGLERKVAAINKQPPSTNAGSSRGSTETVKINPATMSQDEWEALPDSIKNQFLA